MRDITLATTFYQLFTTRSFSTGVPTQLAGSPVVSAYENEGLTQITAGITLGVDHDGVTGLNLLTVVASGANGYESGKDYGFVITTGTVGGVSVVGEVVAEFTIERSAAAVDLANGTDGLGALKAETASIQSDTNDIQTRLPAALTGGKMESNIGSITAGIIAAASFAAGAFDAVWSVAARILTAATNITSTGGTTVPQTGDSFARIGATGSGLTSLSTQASVDVIDANVDLILDDTGTSGVVIVNDGITAAKIAANAIGASELAQDAAQEIADEILNRNLAMGGSGNTRRVQNALRTLRNKQAIAAGTYTCYEEDDATPAFEATVTTAAGNPMSIWDPTT